MKEIGSISILFFMMCLLVGYIEEPTSFNDDQNGLWRQIGYGRILELNDSTIKVYDLNDIDCMLSFEEEILDFAEVIGINRDTLTLKHGIDHWKCVRIEKLPTLCTKQLKNNEDPLYNYDVFWQNFKEHYCSFGIKNIDWDKVGSQFRSKINTETTALELYLVFEEMIALLQDGHIKMGVPESIEKEYKASSNKAVNKYNTLDEFQISQSLAELYVDSLNSVNAGVSRWGIINDSVGYIQINSMLMQANYDVDKNLGLPDFWGQYWRIADNYKDEVHRDNEANGMKATLEKALTEMSNATSFIIDLRFNGGGKDGVAMEILHHFSGYKGKMAIKYVQENGQFVNHQSIVNKPSATHFEGPVYVLTSHRTASAAELAALCSLADKRFKRIGSPTEGIFSSTLDKILPNGWAYEFSNEIYEDLDGVNYEHVGIPPNVEIEYSKVKDEFFDQLNLAIENGTDPAIEAALQNIKINEIEFNKIISQIATKEIPLIDSTNFDNFIKRELYHSKEIGLLHLDKIYPNFDKEGYSYEFVPSYKLKISDKFHSIVVTTFMGEHEMESVLINYDLSGNMIDHITIAYDEIAESASRIKSKIEKSKLTLSNINWFDERIEEIKEYVIDEAGKFKLITSPNDE